MRALHGLISFGHGLADVAPSLLVILAFFTVFTGLAVRSLSTD